MLDKNGIAKRIAREVKDGYYVNLRNRHSYIGC
jgi:acyl CoA:acetate/3-ketoacid CoA transferase beta subunit